MTAQEVEEMFEQLAHNDAVVAVGMNAIKHGGLDENVILKMLIINLCELKEELIHRLTIQNVPNVIVIGDKRYVHPVTDDAGQAGPVGSL